MLATRLCVIIAILFVVQSRASSQVTEQRCREELLSLRELAKNGCSDQVKAKVISCGLAGSAILGCAVTPEPASKIAACFGAVFATADCVDKKAAADICQLQMQVQSESISAIKTGECFTFVNREGCVLVCVKTNTGFALRGVIDPTVDSITRSFRFFPAKE